MANIVEAAVGVLTRALCGEGRRRHGGAGWGEGMMQSRRVHMLPNIRTCHQSIILLVSTMPSSGGIRRSAETQWVMCRGEACRRRLHPSLHTPPPEPSPLPTTLPSSCVLSPLPTVCELAIGSHMSQTLCAVTFTYRLRAGHWLPHESNTCRCPNDVGRCHCPTRTRENEKDLRGERECLLAVTPSKTLSPRCQVAGSKRGGTTRTGGASGARGRRGVGASQGAGSQPLATRRGAGATAAATACKMSGAATGCRTSGVAGYQPGRAPEPPEQPAG
uniref:Expressed protein n=1 Tax=Oryza sativa subsp. japonica TaxID=39947 RepID=Q2R266_ORYSJ|nr:expressed protein [Oryza sativa Japonica Group]